MADAPPVASKDAVAAESESPPNAVTALKKPKLERTADHRAANSKKRAGRRKAAEKKLEAAPEERKRDADDLSALQSKDNAEALATSVAYIKPS
jgi:predicted phage gp36 major capsid-like protein